LLLEATAPLIYAGQGVLYAEASPELLELADLLQAPVMTSVDGKSAFPENHPLSLGTGGIVYTGHGHYRLDAADVVFGVGCSFTPHRITSPSIAPGKKIIHATNDARDLYKTYAVELPILGDAKLVLAQLIEALRERLGKQVHSRNAAQEIARLKEQWLETWKPLTSNERPLNPYRVINEFLQVIDRDETIVTHDSGSPRDQLLPFYSATRPRGYIGWGKSHQLGTGLGLIIGAKIAAPEKFCVNFMGDAAFGMTGLDFETAVRCKVPILTVVLNNSTMAIEIPHMKLSHEKYRSRDLGGNYAALARELGGWSERVDDPGEIANAFRRAQRQTEEGQTCLIEFVTSAETSAVIFSQRSSRAHQRASNEPIWRERTGEDSVNPDEQNTPHLAPGCQRRAPLVRLQEDVWEIKVSRIQARLIVEHIQASGGNPSRLQRRDQRIVIDEIAACDVDNDGVGRHLLEPCAV
jgi:acetolactate synthase-1/2/3 large subunit